MPRCRSRFIAKVLLVVLSMATGVGCGKRSSNHGESGTNDSAKTDSPVCRAHADAFAKWSSAVVSEGRGGPGFDSLKSPLVAVEKRAALTSSGPLLYLTPDWLLVNSQLAAGDGALTADLSATLKSFRLPPQVMLAISGGAAWPRVVAVTNALRRQGVSMIVFLFEGRSAVKAPALKGFALMSFDDAVTGCPNALAALRSVAQLATVPKLARLAADLPAAAIACDCSVDFDALRRIFWSILLRDQSFPVAELRLNIGSGKNTQILSYSASTRWETVVPDLLRREGASVEFRVSR